MSRQRTNQVKIYLSDKEKGKLEKFNSVSSENFVDKYWNKNAR